jgi:hypothetical protein
MKDANAHNVATKQVLGLVQHLMPARVTEDAQQKYLAYFLRVLSGRIFANVVEDEYHLRTLIQKRVAKLHVGRSDASAKLVRFQTLVERLAHARVISKRYRS